MPTKASLVRVVLLAVLLSPLRALESQATGVAAPHVASGEFLPIRDAISAQLERSTIAPFNLGGFKPTLGHFPNSLFEARLFAHFPVFSLERSLRKEDINFCLCGMVFSFAIDIRMSNDASKPVRTPSYKPGVKLFTQIPGITTRPNDFVVIDLFHYSNGQEGPFLRDGLINDRNGSFAQQFNASAAYSHGAVQELKSDDGTVAARVYSSWKAGVEVYPWPDTTVTRDNYGNARLFLTMARSTRKFSREFFYGINLSLWPDGAQRKTALEHLDLESYLGWRFNTKGRLGSFGPFIGYFAERDYLNINYLLRRINNVRIGLMAVNRDYEVTK